MAAPRIALDRSGGVAVVRLDDGRANAIDAAWCAELGAALDAVEGDAALRALVLLGRPGFFCAGLDRDVLPQLEPAALRAMTGAFVAAMERIFLFPKPVVAASAGHALAGGFMLFCAADLRLAVDDARSRYGLPEVSQGVPIVGPTAAICAAAIPAPQHARLLLHGERLSAAAAHACGVVHELLPEPAVLEARALERAAGLRVDPGAYALTKRSLRAPAVAAAAAAMRELGSALPGGNPFRRSG